MWRLNNMLLNKQWATEEIKEEMEKYLETNESGNTTFQNLWDTAKKPVLRRKFTVIGAYLNKQEKSQRNNLNSHLKKLEKEQAKPKVDRRKEIIKNMVGINEVETKIKQ